MQRPSALGVSKAGHPGVGEKGRTGEAEERSERLIARDCPLQSRPSGCPGRPW